MKAAKEIRDANGFAIIIRKVPVTISDEEYESYLYDREKEPTIRDIAEAILEQSETIENMRRHMERESDSTIRSGRVQRVQPQTPTYREPERKGVGIEFGADESPNVYVGDRSVLDIFDLLNIGGIRIGIDPGKGLYVDVKKKR